MREKIGKVALDYSFYPGVDLYSDGQVEEELLEIAKNHSREEFNRKGSRDSPSQLPEILVGMTRFELATP